MNGVDPNLRYAAHNETREALSNLHALSDVTPEDMQQMRIQSLNDHFRFKSAVQALTHVLDMQRLERGTDEIIRETNGAIFDILQTLTTGDLDRVTLDAQIGNVRRLPIFIRNTSIDPTVPIPDRIDYSRHEPEGITYT